MATHIGNLNNEICDSSTFGWYTMATHIGNLINEICDNSTFSTNFAPAPIRHRSQFVTGTIWPKICRKNVLIKSVEMYICNPVIYCQMVIKLVPYILGIGCDSGKHLVLFFWDFYRAIKRQLSVCFLQMCKASLCSVINVANVFPPQQRHPHPAANISIQLFLNPTTSTILQSVNPPICRSWWRSSMILSRPGTTLIRFSTIYLQFTAV